MANTETTDLKPIGDAIDAAIRSLKSRRSGLPPGDDKEALTTTINKLEEILDQVKPLCARVWTI